MKHPLILLHGALGSSKQLNPLKEILQESFEVYSFNFEGHGGRMTNSEFSIALFVQNTLDFMSDNDLKKSAFFGYSMGGYVALKLASLHPKTVERIVTYGTKFNWTPESAAREIKMLDPQKIEEKVPKFAEQLMHLHAPLNWKDVLNNTAQMMLNLGNGTGLTDEEIRSVQQPVTIGIGDLDTMVSIEESTRINDLLPNSKLHVFEGFQHAIDKINPLILSMIIKK